MASGSEGGSTPAPTEPTAPAATYSGNPGLSMRDQVRFLLGDTGPQQWQLSDGEIDFLLAQSSGNAYRAAMQACYSLVAKYSRLADETVGQISVRWSTLKDNFAALADSLQTQQTKFAGGFRAHLTGASRSEREVAEADPDRIGSQFRRQSAVRRCYPDRINVSQNPYMPDWDRVP